MYQISSQIVDTKYWSWDTIIKPPWIIFLYFQTIYLEIVQCHYQSINCINVQMVRRLIHNQDLGVIPNSHCEGDSALLSSWEQVLRPELQIASKSEWGKVASIGFNWLTWECELKLLNGTEHQVELVDVVLCEQTYSKTRISIVVALN